MMIKPEEEETIKEVVKNTTKFDFYKVAAGTKYQTILTGVSVRPATLFLKKLFEGTKFEVTLPGSSELFRFNKPQEIAEYINSQDPKKVLSFCAKGEEAIFFQNYSFYKLNDLKDIFGSNEYKISFGELQETLQSQKVYLTPNMPLEFYKGLKKSMLEDGYDVLPVNNYKKFKDGKTKTFISNVQKNPKEFGFENEQDCENFLKLSLYQTGSMVIKTEDYRIFMDGKGKIMNRKDNQNDAIQLINACGIRDFHYHKNQEKNKEIMTNTFKTAFIASEDGMVVFPAVGMGVWRGDPDIYWRAFLDALVISGSKLKKVLITPGHQTTMDGKYQGKNGNEFEEILQEYLSYYKNDQDAITNLKKVLNLYKEQTDVVQLAHNLKIAFPNEIISLFNASDPDVTLGNHVGEYTNNCPHTNTTEENYTAMGTNGLCFEIMTKVHDDPKRIIKIE
eukprot:gene9831-2153_t